MLTCRVVTKGIKADCSHRMRTVCPDALRRGMLIAYYNRQRITIMNPNGYPPAIYQKLFEAGLSKPAV